MSPVDERALVARVRAGDERAFESLFRTYYGQLCGYAAAMVGSPEEAEEVVQDVWTAVWAQRSEWEVRETAAAYLFRAVHNRALGRVRHGRIVAKWQQDAVAGDRPLAIGARQPGPHEQLVEAEGLAAIARTVASLPERCRQVFLLRQRGLSHAEIASVLDIRPATVEAHMWKALRALRKSVDL